MTDTCAKCNKRHEPEHFHWGRTKSGITLAWYDYFCRDCNTRWVMLGEFKLVS